MTGYPGRWAFVVAEGAIALAGVAGAVQLAAGRFTPPVSDLDALGLDGWTLPGVWLFATVAIPSGAAAWLAWRRSPAAPTAVLIASGLLAVELVVQIPFIGPSVLQGVMGASAAALAAGALVARNRGWAYPRPQDPCRSQL